MTDFDTGRVWSNAPSIVRDARVLAWLGAIGSGLFGIVELATLGRAGPDGAAASVVAAAILIVLCPLYVWLIIGLKRGSPAAYKVQMVLAIIGLIGFPIGTLINGYILYKWFRPETKAWFGV